MLRVGVFGAGHLGKIHIKCLQELEASYKLVGFYDPDEDVAREAARNLGVFRFYDFERLLEAVDVVDIVTPTVTHFAIAAKAIRKGKHVFIEKPIAKSVSEARELVQLSRNYTSKVQIGHVERFNPAFLALNQVELHPMFIEGHRLATFNPRGTDVSVVLDLMIHDLDIILSIVKAPILSIDASGVAVVSNSPDIANARITFANGCVANLTASRISMKQMRKLRIFQKNAYISLDFLKKETQIVKISDKPNEQQSHQMELDTAAGKKFIQVEMPEAPEVNAIKMELKSLADSILHNTPVTVSAKDGYAALKLAEQIVEAIKQQQFSQLDLMRK